MAPHIDNGRKLLIMLFVILTRVQVQEIIKKLFQGKVNTDVAEF
jgi:hypothetical protein